MKLIVHEDALTDVGQARTEASTTVNNENKYRQIFKIKEVHYFALMLLVYVGVGTTIGGESCIRVKLVSISSLIFSTGWSVTYIINVRGGGPNSGYISSGLSGGKTNSELCQSLAYADDHSGVAIGRLALLGVTKLVNFFNFECSMVDIFTPHLTAWRS